MKKTAEAIEARFIPSSAADDFLKKKYIQFDLKTGLGDFSDMFLAQIPDCEGREAEEVYSRYVFTKLGIKNIQEMIPYLDAVTKQELRRYRFILPKI
ncbi:MAG TPA: hypothetical protein VMU88_01225 [bacterium]|nr:hypothetical protein [bacterium]